METLAGALLDVSRRARPYPAHLLAGRRTGLVAFAAAFGGHNDAVHFARHGLRTTCIDVDRDALDEMADIYPADWSFRAGDAWALAEELRDGGRVFDAVSVDTFTGDAMLRALDDLDLWCDLSDHLVTVTATGDASYAVPAGWSHSMYPRARDVYWLTMVRRAH